MVLPSENQNERKRPPPPPPPPAKASTKRELGTPSIIPSSKRIKTQSMAKFDLKFVTVASLRDVEAYAKIQQVGQGTYGSVFMGKDKITHEVVALKRINTEQEENGFPITALREIKILKALNHPNIVQLKEIVTSRDSTSSDDKKSIPRNVFMVFEYAEYDLTGILETAEIRLSQDHIKSWSYQLLSGVHYMHTQRILHRDLKASNLLISKSGHLKIADWGLARSWSADMKRLTNLVITLWYRPPELLLGCHQYSTKIDMWSVGCIIAEMFRRAGFLKGSNEQHQLDLIFQTCGMPDEKDWPDVHSMCPHFKNVDANESSNKKYGRRIRETLKQQVHNRSWLTENAIKLIDHLLLINPHKRASAEEALDAAYFYDEPVHKKADELNMNFNVHSVHEWEARKKQQDIMEQRRIKNERSSNAIKSLSAEIYKPKVRAFPTSSSTKPRPPPPPPPPRGKQPPPPPPPPPN